MSLLSLKRNLTVRNLAANGTNDSDSKWYDDEDAVNDVSAFVHVAAGWRALRRDFRLPTLTCVFPAGPRAVLLGCARRRSSRMRLPPHSFVGAIGKPAGPRPHTRPAARRGGLAVLSLNRCARARTRSHAALHRMCRGHLCLTNTHTALAGIEQRAGMGHQRSRLLNPDFPVAQAVTCVSTVLLVYVAIVVQVEVGFFWHEHLCAVENTALNRYAMLQCAVPALVVLSSVVTHWCPFAVRPCY